MSDEEFARQLEQEVAQWQQEGLVSEAQAKALLARYRLAEGEQRRSRLAVVLAFLGAILVGIGTIVFFAANWQQIPGWTKLVLIFVAVAAAYQTGYWLRYESQTYCGTGNAFLFLGTLLFGATLFLIAQGFHVNAEEPALMVLWAMGVLPMAYLLGSRAMVVLTLLILALALGWETWFWLEDVSHPYSFLAVYLIFGVLLYALGRLHGSFERTRLYQVPYAAAGLFWILGALFPLTFGDLHSPSFSGSLQNLPPGGTFRFGILIAVAGAATLANLFMSRRPSPTTFPEIAALLVLLCLGGALFFLEGGGGDRMALFFNLLLFALIIGTIAVGYWNREPAWVNLGTFFFALQALVRYFDWLWALLPRSLFFIGAGLLLLFGGMSLERARRRVLEQLSEAREER